MPVRKTLKRTAKATRKKSKRLRWGAGALMKLAPAMPARESTHELLTRIKSTLIVPDSPTRKARRS
jgi:hypothetical protein